MNGEEFDPNGEFSIDLNSVQKSKNVMAVVRNLALEMKERPYITLNEFLENISDSDLRMLIDKIDENMIHTMENGDESFSKGFEDVMLLSLLMTSAEGLQIGDIDQVQDKLNRFILCLTCESLHRKGVVKFHRQFATLGNEMDQKILVETL